MFLRFRELPIIEALARSRHAPRRWAAAVDGAGREVALPAEAGTLRIEGAKVDEHILRISDDAPFEGVVDPIMVQVFLIIRCPIAVAVAPRRIQADRRLDCVRQPVPVAVGIRSTPRQRGCQTEHIKAWGDLPRDARSDQRVTPNLDARSMASAAAR